MRSALFTALLGASVLGCVDAPETTSRESSIVWENALSLNALSLNALSLNALSLNALSLNGFIPPTAIDVPNACASAEGREVLRYVAACALPAGTTVACPHPNYQVFSGHIGLAPEWLTGALSVIGQRWVSACLLAHVNNFAVPIQISLAGNHPALARSVTEQSTYVYKEAGFYGNLFRDQPSPVTKSGVYSGQFGRNACQHGVTAWPIANWYLLMRVCALPGSPGATLCQFVDAGRCRPPAGESTSACIGSIGETDSRCAGGQIYPGWLKDGEDDGSIFVTDQVITVFLRRDQAIDQCTQACWVAVGLGLVPWWTCSTCADTIDEQIEEHGGSGSGSGSTIN